VEGLGHVVVGAEAETTDLVLNAGHAGQDEDRRLDLGQTERPQNFITRHVGQVQVKKNDVIVV